MINEERKNTHLTHLEDLVLLGKSGLEELNNYLENIINKSGKVRMTSKIDGAPAVICWSHIDGYPDNSICLKSFVNGPKNALSSVDDIEERHGDRPGMVLMLKYCLQIAPSIPKGEAWQGDCLFTKNTKRERKIGNKSYITFQPNKIIYAFSSDNPGYEDIKNADFGICFHTIYYGKLGALSQRFNVDASQLNVPSNIYVLSPAIGEKKEFELNLEELKSLEEKLLQDPYYEDLCNNEIFMKYWNTFENANLSDKKRTTLDIETFFEDLKQYVNDKMKKEFDSKVSKLKTDKGRMKAEQDYLTALEELQYLLEERKQTIINMVKTINCVADIKMNLWDALKNVDTGYSTFYQKKTGEYEPGHSEGIVMSDDNGNIVKIVDRSQFSNINRSDEYTSGFDHNESLEESLSPEYIEELLDIGFKQPAYDRNTFEYFFNPYESIRICPYGKEGYSIAYTKNGSVVSAKICDAEQDLFNFMRTFNESINHNESLDLEEAYTTDKDTFVDYLKEAGFKFVTNVNRGNSLSELYEYWFNDSKFKLFIDDDGGVDLFYLITPPHRDNPTKIDSRTHFSSIEDAYEFIKETVEESLKHIKSSYNNLNEGLLDYLTNDDLDFIHELEDEGFVRNPKRKDYVEMQYRFSDKERIDVDFSCSKRGIKSYRIWYIVNYFSGDCKCEQFYKLEDLKKFIYDTLDEMLHEDVDHHQATLIWGRMNPITKAHLAMIDFAKKQGGDTFVYLSHSQDNDKNPLPYDRKIYWAQKAAGDCIKKSEAKVIIHALQEIQHLGYSKLVYVCGSDRYEEMKELLNKYNGQMDKKGNILFNFDSIEVKKFGNDRVEEDISLEQCSASLARECVKKDDFETFKQVVPFNEDNATELFNELKSIIIIKEDFKLSESTMSNPVIVPIRSHDYYSDVLRDLSSSTGVLFKDGERYYIDDKNVLKELNKLKSENNPTIKADKFYELTGLRWTNIDKSPYSGRGGELGQSAGENAERLVVNLYNGLKYDKGLYDEKWVHSSELLANKIKSKWSNKLFTAVQVNNGSMSDTVFKVASIYKSKQDAEKILELPKGTLNDLYRGSKDNWNKADIILVRKNVNAIDQLKSKGISNSSDFNDNLDKLVKDNIIIPISLKGVSLDSNIDDIILELEGEKNNVISVNDTYITLPVRKLDETNNASCWLCGSTNNGELQVQFRRQSSDNADNDNLSIEVKLTNARGGKGVSKIKADLKDYLVQVKFKSENDAIRQLSSIAPIVGSVPKDKNWYTKTCFRGIVSIYKAYMKKYGGTTNEFLSWIWDKCTTGSSLFYILKQR